MAHYAYDDVKSMVMRTLRQKETITAEIITSEIDVLLGALTAANLVDNVDRSYLFRDISSQVSVWQPDASVLRDKKHINWVPQRKVEMLEAEIEWAFWKRYKAYLEDEKNRPIAITDKLDSTTDSILGDLGDPEQKGSWDRRGMVVGDVQSGKTSNYTGLICKAVDSGYKLIIVLAGMTNDLRSQTQSRLDAEFLGFESELGKIHGQGSRIGVGKMTEHGKLIAQPLTYSAKDGDFKSKSSANLQLGGNPLLLVVKKNTSVLNRIISWVEGHGIANPETGEKIVKNIPLLLLDDEADNASVNTKDVDQDPTAINKAIRKILKTFSQSSYVGYTATPFANIFIAPDEDEDSKFGEDLFPRNFIYYISPPDNYIGASKIFGFGKDVEGITLEDKSLPLIEKIKDAVQVFPHKHDKELKVNELPATMIKAIRSFVITCAARRVRGQIDVHNSMLIHVTRFNFVQERVQELVSKELLNIQRMLEYKTGKPAQDFLDDLKRIWVSDYEPNSKIVVQKTQDQTLTPIAWEQVNQELLNAALKIQVRGINGHAGGVLDYSDNPKGLNVIAIGGDKLSRGLTLEDLSISYYTRPATNYDTLLQMGRWFGYRPGYLDLCRLYTTSDLVGWYQHIAIATEELKREFKLMESSNLTPSDYGLKVRTHSAGLSITAANKIRSGKRMQVSFTDSLSQTTVFQKNKDIQERNFFQTNDWVKKQDKPEIIQGNLVWKLKSSEVKDFLKGFQIHPSSRSADPELISKYIDKLNEHGELTDWTVALISSEKAPKPYIIGGYDIGLTDRKDASDDSDLYMLSQANIISPTDQYIDLTADQFKQALDKTIAAYLREETRHKVTPTAPSGPYIRNTRDPKNGLLLIYPLNPSKIENSFTEFPIIGYAVSFPKSNRHTLIEYQVNTRYWVDRYGEDDDNV